jgi:hypothetical protein
MDVLASDVLVQAMRGKGSRHLEVATEDRQHMEGTGLQEGDGALKINIIIK